MTISSPVEKITPKELGDFFIEFHDKRMKYHQWRDLRAGQAFCNYFNITDSELFYATDSGRISTLIANYVDWNQTDAVPVSPDQND